MPANYDRDQRQALADAIREGRPLHCPVCGAHVARRDIAPKREVGYVRRRWWLICSGCRRSATVDVRPAGPR